MESLDLNPPSSDDELYSEDSENSDTVTNAGKGTFKIYSEDGEFIGFCEFKRYKWYLNKGLAEKYALPSDPESIGLKLNFKPRNPESEGYKKIIKRKTICHCCGSVYNLRKFHVLPSQIKKYYPNEKKMHNITDILLVCKECAGNANQCTDEFKNKICTMLQLKTVYFCDTSKDKIRSLAIKLYKKYDKNKINRSNKYLSTMNKIKEILNIKEDLTNEQIIEYTKLDCKKEYDGSPNIGHYIAKKFNEKGKLDYLTNKWKSNFILCMKPQFLPPDFVQSLLNICEGGDIDDDIKEYLSGMGFSPSKSP